MKFVDAMSVLKIKVNESTLKRIKKLAQKDKVSINHFLELTIAEKVSALDALEYLDERSKSGSYGDIKRLLMKVPDRAPLDYDKIDN